ncbi:CvpA family protein [Flavobacterium capsici]|uniref:CvpA family protein n=1 Tax=Flavobacterium capsici TaxID=3075618 RepID=A0AA96EZ76_9FLAO|nr:MULTISPECIES: CvpA family protein [unclassified Flavobacterium]WNM19600.1 CvpA family protein [Flavobacterium sp. PMR2A8]WNM20989.1 CvpA family protein [Flavobacterium sp. PMTSA4]
MSYIDIILGGLLIFGLIRGIKNGLFVELASLISFFIGIYIAVKFSYIVGGFIGDSKTAKVAAFVITLILVIVGIHLLAKVFSKIANFVFLGWLNRLGGAVFAVLKTALLLGIVLSLFQKVNIDNAIISKETQEESIFFNPIMKTSEILLPVLNDWFIDLREKVSSN